MRFIESARGSKEKSDGTSISNIVDKYNKANNVL